MEIEARVLELIQAWGEAFMPRKVRSGLHR